MQYAGELLALAAAFFFGGSVVYMRLGMIKGNRDMAMLITLLVNNIINMILVTIWYFLSLIPPLSLKGLAFFALAGFLTSNLGRLCQTISMECIGASRASAFKIGAPIFTIFIGVFILKEQVSLPALGGMAIVLVGLLVITQSMKDKPVQGKSTDSKANNQRLNNSDQVEKQVVGNGAQLTVAKMRVSSAEKDSKSGKIKLTAVVKKGIIFGVVAGLAFATGQVFRKLGIEAIPSSVIGAAIGSLVAITFYWLVLVRRIGFGKFKEMAAVNYNSSFVISGILSSLALYSFFMSLKFTTVSKANVLINTEVFTTMVIGYFVLGKSEKINMMLVLGVVAVFLGVVLTIIY